MLADRFISYIEFEKRYSPHTLKAYRNDLDQFSSYLRENYETDSIEKADHMMIRSWIVYLIDNSISPRSVNRKITTLKSFYRFMIKEGLLDENPMNRITAPKPSQKLPVFVEKEKMDMLLDDVDFGEGYPASRDRLIVELLYGTGIRLSELAALEETDLNLAKGTIKVTGKRNKERIIPLTLKLGELIDKYMEDKGQETHLNQNSYLFVTNKGGRIYPKMIYRVVNTYLNKVTTISKKSPHVLRHTFATHMLDNGADLNAIKELLGHASLAATQVYTHNTIEKLKSIYNQAHPKA